MGIECEELVELQPRLETQTATANFVFSPVTQTIVQIAVGHDISQMAANLAGAFAVHG